LDLGNAPLRPGDATHRVVTRTGHYAVLRRISSRPAESANAGELDARALRQTNVLAGTGNGLTQNRMGGSSG
jgi:hypothetical protein